MATIKKTAGAQYVLSADFTFGYTTGGSDGVNSDSMVNTSGVLTAFSAATGTTFDLFTLPYGAEVTSGTVDVLTAVTTTATATANIGDSASAARYVSAVNLKSAARTAFTITGYQGLGEAIRIAISNADGTGAVGQVKVSAQFILKGRVHENLKTT